MDFQAHLKTIIPFTEELEKRIAAIARKECVKKDHSLITIGERCNTIYFIEKGLLRGFYFKEDKEITNWFASEGEFATSFYSFISGQPSQEAIVAVEDCELVCISEKDLQALYKNYPVTERIGRIITENYYIKLEGRLLNLQFKTAKERYNNLVNNHPSLFQRANLGHIASWLGITQETLSRIRAEL